MQGLESSGVPVIIVFLCSCVNFSFWIEFASFKVVLSDFDSCRLLRVRVLGFLLWLRAVSKELTMMVVSVVSGQSNN